MEDKTTEYEMDVKHKPQVQTDFSQSWTLKQRDLVFGHQLINL